MRILKAGNEGSVNPVLNIHVLDEPGVGGAHHEYEVYIDETKVPMPEGGLRGFVAKVHFQTGAIAEAGINGCTNEALLAIVVDRLECFSKGPFPSRETSIALTKCQEALHWLTHRTRERELRGVEGLHAK